MDHLTNIYYEYSTHQEEYVDLTPINYYDDDEEEDEICEDSLTDDDQSDSDQGSVDYSQDLSYDPTHQSYVKTVLMTKICNDIENDVHWQLLEQEFAQAGESSTPQLIHVYDGQSQAFKDQMHSPICRCSSGSAGCSLTKEKLIQNLCHRRNPYSYFNPQDSYVSE